MSELKASRLARLGWAASQDGDHEQAIAALSEAVVLSPSKVELLNALGLALARALRPADALPYLLKSVALNADDIEVWCVIGEMSVERLDYTTAQTALKKCLALDPTATHPAGIRARALIKKAEKQLKKSLSPR